MNDPKIFATLTRLSIKANNPCANGLLAFEAKFGHLDHTTPVPLLSCLESNPLDDVVWALRAVEQDLGRTLSRLAIDFAEGVLPLFPEPRLTKALEVFRAFVNHRASDSEVQEARDNLRGLLYDRLPDDDVQAAVVRSVAFAGDGTRKPDGNPYATNLASHHALVATVLSFRNSPEAVAAAAAVNDPDDSEWILTLFGQKGRAQERARQVEILKRYFSETPL